MGCFGLAKTVRALPAFKPSDIGDICSASVVLPCLWDILKCGMHDHFYKYLLDDKILYSKQFVLQKGHATGQAIVHIVDQIYESLKKATTLSVFTLTCRNNV